MDSYYASVTKDEADVYVTSYYSPVEGFHVIAQFAPTPYYFTTTEGSTEVLYALNRSLSQINMDRPYIERELYEKYLGIEFNTALTIAERNLIAASAEQPVVVGVIDNCAPVNFWNGDTGAYEGITIDMLNAVSDRTGLCFQYVPVDLSRRDSATTPNENSPKLVLGVPKAETISDARGWYLSDGLLSDSLAVVCLQGRNLSAEQGKKTVAVMANFAMARDYAKLYMPEFTIVEYSMPQECLDAVTEEKADSVVYVHSSISYFLQKPRYDKLEIIPTYSEGIDMCVAGFTKDTKAYISIIDKGLHMVPESESKSITLNYTVNNPYKLTIADTMYKYRVPMRAIVCLTIFIIALLTALYLIKQKATGRCRLLLPKRDKPAPRRATSCPA